MAMLNQTKPIGTHAHEWFMFHAARYGYKMANTLALEHWVDVYRGDLGIALSDTYTSDVFFNGLIKNLPSCLTVYAMTAGIHWNLLIKQSSIIKSSG